MSNIVELVKKQDHPTRYNREVFDDLKKREAMRSKLKQLNLSRAMIMDMMRDYKTEMDEVIKFFEYGDSDNQGGAA
jgi:hypothetical protein